MPNASKGGPGMSWTRVFLLPDSLIVHSLNPSFC